MSKQATLISLSVILIAAAVGYYFFYIYDGQDFDIRKFSGDIVSINRDLITLNGIFGTPAQAPPEELLADSERDFSFRVDETTIFEKLDIAWPTLEDVAAAGGTLEYSVEDLPKEQVKGSLEDIQDTLLLNPGAVFVEAEFPSSIYDKSGVLVAWSCFADAVYCQQINRSGVSYVMDGYRNLTDGKRRGIIKA